MSESITQTIDLAVPRQELWDLLMDPTRLGDWVAQHRKVLDEPPLPQTPLDVGDRFGQKLGFGPISFCVRWEVVEAEAPGRARWRGEGPKGSQAEVLYELSELDGGGATRFRYCNDYELPGGIMGRAAKRAFGSSAGERETRKSLRRLEQRFGAAEGD